MRELDYRSSSHRSRHTSRSKSRDRDRDRDYYSRRKRSKSRSRTSKSKKKKSKKKRYRRSSSSSSSSSRSRGSIRSGTSSARKASHTASTEENPLPVQAPREFNINLDVAERITIDKIDEDSFTSKPFYSTADSKKISEKVIINLKDDTISVEGKADDPADTPELSEMFHPNFLGDDSQKMEKWVKKLYNYRQKAFQD